MSLKDLDDWLKPTDVEPENVSNDVVEDVGIENDIEDPIMSALSASDLQLLFLDLEFLDLASGPSGPSVQDKERGVVASHGKRQEMKERQEEVRTRLSI